MQVVDSHCHLDFPELAGKVPELLGNMAAAGVGWALCAGVTLERFAAILDLARTHPNLFAAVGVHPDHQEGQEPDVDRLVSLSAETKVVAIGETGLDYYRLSGDLAWQRSRFRTHIAAAKATGKPLIIHTRSASRDTLDIVAAPLRLAAFLGELRLGKPRHAKAGSSLLNVVIPLCAILSMQDSQGR